MRSNYLKTLKTAVLAVCILLLGAGVSAAQSTVILTAAPTTLTAPDGTAVPMWGYTCGTAVTATCAPLNPAALTTPTIWSPVIIREVGTEFAPVPAVNVRLFVRLIVRLVPVLT